MPRVADLSAAPEYIHAWCRQRCRAARIDGVLHRADGLFVSLGEAALHHVPAEIATDLDVGDYLLEGEDDADQFICSAGYFENFFEVDEPACARQCCMACDCYCDVDAEPASTRELVGELEAYLEAAIMLLEELRERMDLTEAA